MYSSVPLRRPDHHRTGAAAGVCQGSGIQPAFPPLDGNIATGVAEAAPALELVTERFQGAAR